MLNELQDENNANENGENLQQRKERENEAELMRGVDDIELINDEIIKKYKEVMKKLEEQGEKSQLPEAIVKEMWVLLNNLEARDKRTGSETPQKD